jgi:hypothetical protein
MMKWYQAVFSGCWEDIFLDIFMAETELASRLEGSAGFESAQWKSFLKRKWVNEVMHIKRQPGSPNP